VIPLTTLGSVFKESEPSGGPEPLKRAVSLLGTLIFGLIILMMLVFAVGALFFRNEFLPK
jgi:hypothetical protein